MKEKLHHFFHSVELSALATIIGVIMLFSTSVLVILIAPSFIDPSWTEPTSSYQVQMYEVADPHFYIGKATSGSSDLQFVYHLVKDYTLLAFKEAPELRIVAPENLEKFITKEGSQVLKLTSQLLMLREPSLAMSDRVQKKQKELQEAWEKENPDWKERKILKPSFEILELYTPNGEEAFSVVGTDGILEDWIDKDYELLEEPKHPYHRSKGVIYINNPREYRIEHFTFGGSSGWRYNPKGDPIVTLDQLKKHALGFHSRQELIRHGEHIYAIEGCWYCHTDQTRTLVQDVVMNGSANYPAPPSTANEYIYQRITFPGTRRIGPDISRTGVKRPYRDWHKGHFWAPKTASAGSIMPAFRHFFDNDPRGQGKSLAGVPNYQFEAIYQYLMTKGTRITPPTQAWWLGKDPVDTKAIIEGRKFVK